MSEQHGTESDPYKLKLHKGHEHELFDGRNGSLTNGQGYTIQCYVPDCKKRCQQSEAFPTIDSADKPPAWMQGFKRRKSDDEEDEDYVPE